MAMTKGLHRHRVRQNIAYLVVTIMGYTYNPVEVCSQDWLSAPSVPNDAFPPPVFSASGIPAC